VFAGDDSIFSSFEFDSEFVTLSGYKFLHIVNSFAGAAGATKHLFYSISSHGELVKIPWQWDPAAQALLKGGEGLRSGVATAQEGYVVSKESIARPGEANCCASGGFIESTYKLEGRFKQNPETHVYYPAFHFIVIKHLRAKD
jgi:hypothetical protein